MMRSLLALSLLWLLTPTLFAATLETKSMRARKVAPTMKMTAVYGELKNTGAKPIGITQVEASVAGMTSLHETIEEGGLSRMKHLKSLTLAPGETVSFVPGGKHIMLEQLKDGWSALDKLTLRFTYDDGSTQDVSVLIQENP